MSEQKSSIPTKYTKEELLSLLARDERIMEILTIVKQLHLRDSWLCAGSIRNFIWNTLSGKVGFDNTTDVDVVFFDDDISYEKTVEIEKYLKQQFPDYRWELKNQVYMHHHNPNTEPYTSSREAISKYPECCTAIGLRLNDENALELFTPYGLEDILTFRVHPTPHFLQDSERMQLYHYRQAQKNWKTKWPRLIID